MTPILLLILLAGVAVGWLHSTLGRVAGTALAVLWVIVFAVHALITHSTPVDWAVHFAEAMMGFFIGIALHGLKRDLQRRHNKA